MMMASPDMSSCTASAKHDEVGMPPRCTWHRKEVSVVEWIAPDFEEVETEAEVTAYAGHWEDGDDR